MKKHKQKKKKLTQKPVEKKSKISPQMRFWAKNVGIGTLFFMLIFMAVSYLPAYNWLSQKFVKRNMQIIFSSPDLTTNEKLEIKGKFQVKYLLFLKKNTPKNAIILMPPDSIFLSKDNPVEFNKYITRKIWSSYFLHPRKVVYEDEKEVFPELYKKATHVAIVNSWGYDKINHKVSKKEAFAVTPIKR